MPFYTRWNFRSIQAKLFVIYSLLIVSFFSFVSVVFYLYTVKQINEKSSETIFQTANNISVRLASKFEEMDNTSMKIIFSDAIKSLLFEDIDPQNESARFRIERNMNKEIYSIMGPLQSDWQINLIRPDGRFQGTGEYSFSAFFPKERVQALQWFREAAALDGSPSISAPRTDDWVGGDRKIVSLTRKFRLSLSSSQYAVVEIQWETRQLEELVARLNTQLSDSPNNSRSVFVFDGKGFPVYSSNRDSGRAAAYWTAIRSRGAPSGSLFVPGDRGRDMVAFAQSNESGWTVAVSQSEDLLLAPVKAFRNALLLGVLGLLLLTLLVSYLVARGLTLPIKKMHKSIRSLSLETLLPASQQKTGGQFNELDVLHTSFQNMCARLESSLQETLQLRTKEMQARMVALQSQMNPHFLYNTLTNISVMAEDRGHDEIVRTCKHLSVMLRYILGKTASDTTIEQEMEYTLHYLELMQVRYAGRMEFEIDWDPSMKRIPVPMLVVQPIVENIFKHGNHVPPPWKISIRGAVDGKQWTLRICDNGTGFPPEILSRFGSFGQAASLSPVPEREKGLGLENIQARLRLAYGAQAVFELSNSPQGGACVTIGGSAA